MLLLRPDIEQINIQDGVAYLNPSNNAGQRPNLGRRQEISWLETTPEVASLMNPQTEIRRHTRTTEGAGRAELDLMLYCSSQQLVADNQLEITSCIKGSQFIHNP
jgi:hypothetical protein